VGRRSRGPENGYDRDCRAGIVGRHWIDRERLGGALAFVLALATMACGPDSLDDQLRAAIEAEGIGPLDYGTSPDPQRVALGRALFYDKELSGNRDVACATCHHPATHTADGLSLPIGTGGTGLGSERMLGTGRRYLPRHTPELFSRGVEDWRAVSWDGRLRSDEPWLLPDGVTMPDAIGEDVMAARAMLEVADRNGMRGNPGDRDVNDEENTLSFWPDDDLPAMWDELMARLLAIPAYVDLFAAAYPDVDPDDLGFEHAALAISAYQLDAFSLSETPWDLYVEGDTRAMVEPAKRGALLFFGKAGCSECHAGPLLTDQEFHDICAPQLGTAADRGRGALTGQASDDYAFRTPPLRNVGWTGPYMHAGSHASLEDAVRHHLNACAKLRTYEGEGLPERFRELVLADPELLDAIEANAAPMAKERMELGTEEISDLMQFLEALNDPAAITMDDLAPQSVPSGLPVDR
jgi:cytochrome c peroxidase